MSVRVLAGWSDPDWDEEVRRHREATLFHTRLWTQICTRSFPRLRDRSVWIEVTTGAGSSRHLLPLIEWRRFGGILSTTHSTFPHLYGGPLPARGAGGVPVLPEVLAFLGERRGSLVVSTNPLAERPFDLVPGQARDSASEWSDDDVAARTGLSVPQRGDDDVAGSTGHGAPQRGDDVAARDSGGARRERGVPRRGGWEEVTRYTHLRTLPRTEEEFWEEELPSTRRNDVRRMAKKGVVVAESRAREDIVEFHRLYLASFRRWGGRPAIFHPEGFYHNLLAYGGEHVRLSVVRHEGAVIGGAIHLRFGSVVHYLAGYFDAEAKALRPNVLLQVESIRQAIRDGFAFYDFLPSGEHESVEQFKEGFGGLPAAVASFTHRSLGHRALAKARERWTILGSARRRSLVAGTAAGMSRGAPTGRPPRNNERRPESPGR